MSRAPFSFGRLRSESQTPPARGPSRDRSRPARQLSVSPPPPENAYTHQRPRRSSGQLRGMRRLEQRRTMEEQHYLSSKARAQNYNPPVDLRLLDYISPQDDNLICPICRCPFVEPVVLEACDHCFCRDCIRQCWHNNRTYNPLGPKGDCPTCRTPSKLGPRNATSKILVNIIDDLVVKCPKSDEGCRAEVKRGEVTDHVAIYCPFALVECVGDDCDLPVRRKDVAQGCLHYSVSCASCRAELQKWKLEAHWQNDCPDRQIVCELCKSAVFSRELEKHNKETCPAIGIPCPGQALGCTARANRGQLKAHTKNCTLAKLAPMMERQQQRLDAHEIAQKQMSRKLEVLENGFSALQGMLYPSVPTTDQERVSEDSGNIPILPPQRRPSDATALGSRTPTAESFDFPVPPSSHPGSPNSFVAQGPDVSNARSLSTEVSHALRHRPVASSDVSITATYSANNDDFNFLPASPPTGPYASPLHHLLSLHESLRDEVGRVSAALSELDGRHAMQNLNENLRTREEISYLGAQVAGLQRQVHWLTSAQLQRVQGQHRGGAGPAAAAGSRQGLGAGGSGGEVVGDASGGAGVEAAVSTLRNASVAVGSMVSGAGGQQGVPMRRRTSEEGKTKL